MRALLIAVLLAAPSAAHAGLLDISGIGELVAEKAKEVKAASLIGLDMGVSGALYLPVYSLHGKRTSPTVRPTVYAELGLGAEMREGGDYRPFVNMAFDFPAITRRIWNSNWRKHHLSMTKLPPIMVGPYIRVPTTLDKSWVIGSEVGAMVSIGLGGK